MVDFFFYSANLCPLIRELNPIIIKVSSAVMNLKDACSLESYDRPRWLIKKQSYHFASKGPYS